MEQCTPKGRASGVPKKDVFICGTGSAAHVLVAGLAGTPHWRPTLFSLSSRGSAFRDAIRCERLRCDDVRADRPSSFATCDTVSVLTLEDLSTEHLCADIIVLAIPAFAHEPYLRALIPICRDDAIVLLMPAYGFADLLVREVWQAQARKPHRLHTALMDTLPWVTRTQEFGRKVTVFAHKRTVGCVVLQLGDDALPSIPDTRQVEVVQHLMQKLYCGELRMSTSPMKALPLSLFLPNAIMHATLMYGFYQCQDGGGFWEDAFQESPPFYSGASSEAAAILDAVSEETLCVKNALVKAEPAWAQHLSLVTSFHNWIRSAYLDTIEDATSTASCLQTNEATRNLLHPMTVGEDGLYRPDFTHRYLSEDVPYGLLAIKSLARVANIETVALDKVMKWAQMKLKESWVDENGKLAENAQVEPARTVQRFGICSIDDLRRHYCC